MLHKHLICTWIPLRHVFWHHKSAQSKHVSSFPLPQKLAQWELIEGVVVCRASCEPKLGGLRWRVSRLQEVAAWKKELETFQTHSIYCYKLPPLSFAEQFTGTANLDLCQKVMIRPRNNLYIHLFLGSEDTIHLHYRSRLHRSHSSSGLKALWQ